MKDLNLTFFKEYTQLDNLLKEVYGAPDDKAGVTHYLELMQNTPPSQARCIAGWESCYKRLRYLRHIRNNLAHNPDAFESEDVTREDIAFVQNFSVRVQHCEDPLSPIVGRKKKDTTHAENVGCLTASLVGIALVVIICICIAVFDIHLVIP